MIPFGSFAYWILFLLICVPPMTIASEPSDPESAIRRMVQANADKDLSTLSQLMAHDADIISYGVAGRKYVGWSELEQGIKDEFLNAQKLDIPIQTLKVWTKGDFAWYAMELDYIRYVADGPMLKRTVLPMQETGVLERRHGRWQLLSWHESFRSAQLRGPLTQTSVVESSPLVTDGKASRPPDLSGDGGTYQRTRRMPPPTSPAPPPPSRTPAPGKQ